MTHSDAPQTPQLRFGTAGLRGTVGPGPAEMNPQTVARAAAGIVDWLRAQGTTSGTIVVGRDARHGSAEFARIVAEIAAGAGFMVLCPSDPTPTPVIAFATRAHQAVAGVVITASHNPPSDNGLKLYLAGGTQIISPQDREIEAAMRAADPDAAPRGEVTDCGDLFATEYLAALPFPSRSGVTVALTALHGVGGEVAVKALTNHGYTVHVVESQQQPDPDFPTVSFPNPEEPGATDELLALARAVHADVAIALDPDADRCAVGIDDGGWRMLSGDETGVLVGEYIMQHYATGPDPVVASSIVSSTLLDKVAESLQIRHERTLTGFKNLMRAGGDDLVYAYEEALGLSCFPQLVSDKDGISAALMVCDLIATQGQLASRLDWLWHRFGHHLTKQVSLRVSSAAQAQALVAELGTRPPATIGGYDVTVSPLPETPGYLLTGAGERCQFRFIARPSGTEAKAKCYIEVVCGYKDVQFGRSLVDELVMFASTLGDAEVIIV